MARPHVGTLVVASLLWIGSSYANKLSLKVLVYDCSGPVHGAKVEISECVDRRLRATTDSNGLAVFAKGNGIEYCSQNALYKCAIAVTGSKQYDVKTLKGSKWQDVSPREYVCGLDPANCGSEPKYQCMTHDDFVYEPVLWFQKLDCDDSPCVIQPWGKCGGESKPCKPGKHGLKCKGKDYTKCKCTEGYQCQVVNKHHSQCVPDKHYKRTAESVSLSAPYSMWPPGRISENITATGKDRHGHKTPCVLKPDAMCGGFLGPFPKCSCSKGYSCQSKGRGYYSCQKQKKKQKKEEKPEAGKPSLISGKKICSQCRYNNDETSCEKCNNCLWLGTGQGWCVAKGQQG